MCPLARDKPRDQRSHDHEHHEPDHAHPNHIARAARQPSDGHSDQEQNMTQLYISFPPFGENA
jgi:hypothetical protein